MKADDVLKAEDLIRRIRVIRSFLSDIEVRYVTHTYKLHNFYKTEEIECFDGIIIDIPSSPGCVLINHPDEKNFSLCIRTMEKILNNHCILYEMKYQFRVN